MLDLQTGSCSVVLNGARRHPVDLAIPQLVDDAAHALAIWHLPDGPLPYAQGWFVPDSIAYDIPPGDTGP